MLLGGLLLCVQDSAAAECSDGNMTRDVYDQRNLLSSACSDSACSTGSASSSAIQVTNEYQSFTGSEEYSTDVEPTNGNSLTCH
uniref:Putative secreted protein n=1 Tax=Xenopsylla cheopis TaxID=163159 RepID=A0A6M2E2J0_XENCH